MRNRRKKQTGEKRREKKKWTDKWKEVMESASGKKNMEEGNLNK